MTEPLYRREALQEHEGGEHHGDLLRFDTRWTRLAVKLIVAASVIGFLAISLLGVDEYAQGPAVVRIDGRRMVTATSPATVETVEVKPGQWIEAGAVLSHMVDQDERNELVRATNEFELQLARMLRDPNDPVAKQTLAALRSRKDQAKNVVESRTLRAPVSGYVSDVRVRVGQHVNPGDVVAAVAPKDAGAASLVVLLPAEYRPMLRQGQKLRFELDGFRYEYADLAVLDVSAEAIGPLEVQRFLGQDREGAVALTPGAKVLVTAKLPASSFTSEGKPYGYFDGLTGSAEVRVRREPILVTLVPALKALLPEG